MCGYQVPRPRATTATACQRAIAQPRGAPRRYDLLVTVDNGIGSVEGVAAAMQLGLPVLVTDHHLPGRRPAHARRHGQPQPARLHALPGKTWLGWA